MYAMSATVTGSAMPVVAKTVPIIAETSVALLICRKNFMMVLSEPPSCSQQDSNLQFQDSHWLFLRRTALAYIQGLLAYKCFCDMNDNQSILLGFVMPIIGFKLNKKLPKPWLTPAEIG